jgi:hypothetical protein
MAKARTASGLDKPRVVHVYGTATVLPLFRGSVIIRRRLERQPARVTGMRGHVATIEMRKEHANVPWTKLTRHQKTTYLILDKGQSLGVLTDWEINFLWSLASFKRLSPKQLKVAHRIGAKVYKAS